MKQVALRITWGLSSVAGQTLKHIYEVKVMEWEYVWDSIYFKEGEVQKDLLPTVVSAVELFKSSNVKNVLDLGCGTGRHSIFLANSGFAVTATDIS
ncbi:MAG: hypothetical protein GX808_14485, partial [Syntrophomonadaceae bacterium]|nr:hypothetical protein [Syntrophomonadaceae bacterium]